MPVVRIVLRSQREGEIDISKLGEKSGLLFRVRGGLVSLIFQEPMTALSPVPTIGKPPSVDFVCFVVPPSAGAAANCDCAPARVSSYCAFSHARTHCILLAET
jgi:hypothetical protein